MEELDIQSTLDRIAGQGLTPIERILAAHTGTVQLLVSLWFAEAADAVVKYQGEYPEPTPGGEIRREVALTLRHRQMEVVSADTLIPIAGNDLKVLALVRARVLGLGQIAVYLGIPTKREILSLLVKPDYIVRKYRMTDGGHGPALHFIIEETFPRRLYAAQSPALAQAGLDGYGS